MAQDPKKPDGEDEEAGAPDHPGEEFFVAGATTDDGRVVGIHHGADHSLQPVVMHPMQDGVPIPDGATVVKRRAGSAIYDAVDIPGRSPPSKGPAKVNSAAYCDGYDRIFGKRTIGEA